MQSRAKGAAKALTPPTILEDDAGGQELHAPRFSVRSVFRLAAAVIVAALTAVLIVLLLPDLIPRDAITYRIMVALVCFVLSSISALLFATRASITGTMGILTVSVVGPAAMWLIALFAFNQFFPERDLALANEAERAEFFIERAERRAGWKTYIEWGHSLGRGIGIIRENEEGFIKQMLPRVFYHGQDTAARLADPLIQTAFIYLKGSSVKLQRISGTRSNGVSPQIYVTGAPSLATGKAASYLFVRDNNAVVAGLPVVQGEWREVRSNPVECLVISLYLEDEPKEGDWIYVDLPKYIGNAPEGGTVDLDVLTVRPITQGRMWEMSASQLTDRTPAPLLFREAGGLSEEDDISLEPELTEWLRLLDRARQTPELDSKAMEFIGEARKVLALGGGGLAEWSTKHKIRQRSHYRATGVQNGTMATFIWSEPAEGAESAIAQGGAP